MAESKTTEYVGFDIPKDEKKFLKEQAKANGGMSVSALLRKIVSEWIGGKKRNK